MKFPTKEQTKEWLKNPYNLMFILILIFAIGIRFYYFELTINQPVWWDESEYLSAGKNFAGIVDYQLNKQRNALFPLIISIFYRLGISEEHTIRFLLLFIPSILVILLIYFCVKEMYEDKRIALISIALATVLWEHLFYSNRFHTENFAMIFGILSAYLIFKLYLKKQDMWILKHKYAVIYIMICAVISFLLRTGNIIFIPLSILYILIIEKTQFFKKREIIYGGIGITVLILLQLIYNYISRGDLISGYLTYTHFDKSISYASLNVFKGFFESLDQSIPSILYYLFLWGVIFTIFEIYINKNKLLNLKGNIENNNLKGDIYSLLSIIIMLSMFIFILRDSTYEFRWFFPLLVGMFVITSKGILTIADYTQYFISENKKGISITIILILLIPGLYYELEHADSIIRIKLESYSQVRDAGLWIKANSDKQDKIFSISLPQNTYYSERQTFDYYINDSYTGAKTEIEILEQINQLKPKFLIVSIFENHPPAIFNLTQNRQDIFTPINAFFLDKERKQMALVIYQINYYNMKNEK